MGVNSHLTSAEGYREIADKDEVSKNAQVPQTPYVNGPYVCSDGDPWVHGYMRMHGCMNEEEGAHLVGNINDLVAPQESTRVHGGQGKTYYCCGNLKEDHFRRELICQAAPQLFEIITHMIIITSSASM